jgi:hypothetical protein
MPAKEGIALRLGSIAPQKVSESSKAWVLKPNPAQVTSSIGPAVMATPTPETSKTPEASPTPEATPDAELEKGCLLRPMLTQIENLKGGGVEGQLLVYQVFLRVPFQLLHDEGIKSLQLVDEKTVIRNPELHAAIVKAAKDVAKIDLPPFEAT